MDPFTRVSNKISNTRHALVEWSKAKFGSLKREIEEVRAKLAVFFDQSLAALPGEDRLRLELKLQELLQKEQIFWKQRSRILWLSEGDMNTRYFHQCALNRKKKNLIKRLRDVNGVWRTDDKEIQDVVLSYYKELFQRSYPANMGEVTDTLPRVITEEMNVDLTKDVSNEEVSMALKQMKLSKAPIPEGFAPCFYQ
ncbi:uncharacterized protein LOC112171081 [Rosa chinensis]|uniref:uncharacterized protein LOC112171081 n=1 Tax=Rosa chinensis TaxID=74649 RepID=UPI000D0914A3|nr:uncharacterized protein LOC112171081 [Rosa chinensis]